MRYKYENNSLFDSLQLLKSYSVPVLQFLPANPGGHMHWKSLTRSLQVALCWQGLDKQSSISKMNNNVMISYSSITHKAIVIIQKHLQYMYKSTAS